MNRYVIARVHDGVYLSTPQPVDLPPMQPGDSVRVTMCDDGTLDVVPLTGMDRWEWPYPHTFEGRPLWVDAPEQENDRG